MTSETIRLQSRVAKLEHELEEMTTALTQAWDQLVPFLQETPSEAQDFQDMIPILQAIMAAADSDCAGVYLFQSDEWFSVPEGLFLHSDLREQVRNITSKEALKIDISAQRWIFAPVISEHEIIGALGIGTYNKDRNFTAVDTRIVTRMAERLASQIVAAQLARIREHEAIMEREIQIANEIQHSIQPRTPPRIKGIEIEAYWKPFKHVGGDAWGWVMQGTTHLTWFILDIAGKGLPSALAAMSLHTAIRMGLQMNLSPAEVLRVTNNEFYDAYTLTDLMATAVILRLDMKTGQLELANAGHTPVLVRHKGEWVYLNATVPPIGVMTDLKPVPQYMTLQKNDLIICYSDGFTEIEVGQQMWGETGLLKAIPAGAKAIKPLVRYIVETAQRVGNIRDDQTLIAALYTGDKTFMKTIAATLESVSDFMQSLDQDWVDMPLADRIAITLPLQELCVNIVEHAYNGHEGQIHIEMRLTKQDIDIEITDSAPNVFMIPQEIAAPNPGDLPEGGMGLFIIYQSFDSVKYQRLENGNRWHLIKKLSS